jgi:hypothetical protein
MAAITTAALGVGMSAYQIYQGQKQKSEANRALNDYERQELDNAYKDIQISTMGSDLLREENARTSAGLVDSMQQAGSRAIIGGVPKVVGATNQINQQAAKMLDDQFMNREYAIAGDNARIEGITENRDVANINALSSQAQAGQQDMWSGMMGAASGLAYGAKNIDFSGNGSYNQQNFGAAMGNEPRPQMESGIKPTTMAPTSVSMAPTSNSMTQKNYYDPFASNANNNMYGYDFMDDNYGKKRF